MTPPLVEITHHAERRWRQRVGWQGRPIAVSVLAFVAGGHASKRPPRWMHRDTDGTVYVVNADQPGICALVKEGCVVTVVDRRSARLFDRLMREDYCTGRRKAMA